MVSSEEKTYVYQIGTGGNKMTNFFTTTMYYLEKT